MKSKRNTLVLVLAAGLMILAGNVFIAAKKKWSEVKIAETTAEIAKAEADSAVARAAKVVALLPNETAPSPSPKAKEVASAGVVRLLNLARQSGVAVTSISPESKAGNSSTSGTAIDQIAASIPMTDGAVKRVAIKMNVGFTSLDALMGFVAAIPQSNGYLSKIKITKDRAELSIRFVGA